jgi:hypothetical protein
MEFLLSHPIIFSAQLSLTGLQQIRILNWRLAATTRVASTKQSVIGDNRERTDEWSAGPSDAFE